MAYLNSQRKWEVRGFWSRRKRHHFHSSQRQFLFTHKNVVLGLCRYKKAKISKEVNPTKKKKRNLLLNSAKHPVLGGSEISSKVRILIKDHRFGRPKHYQLLLDLSHSVRRFRQCILLMIDPPSSTSFSRLRSALRRGTAKPQLDSLLILNPFACRFVLVWSCLLVLFRVWTLEISNWNFLFCPALLCC